MDMFELNESSEMAIQPTRLTNPTLMQHQLRALHRCRQMEIDGFGISDDHSTFQIKTRMGVFGDTNGSGKSHVMLALIASDDDRCSPRERITSHGDGRILVRELETLVHVKTTVIVIPHTLTSKWESYLTCLPWANTLTISRKKSLDRLTPCIVKDLDVILVTNTFYSEVVRVMAHLALKPRRMIIDEADTIAITSMSSLDTSFSWYITSSYENLLFPNGNMRYEPSIGRNVSCSRGIGHQGHIRSLFIGLHQSMTIDNVRRIVVKNNLHTIHTSMHMGTNIHETVLCQTPHCIRVSTGMVDEAVLACLDGGCLENVCHQISPEKRHCVSDVTINMSQMYVDRLKKNEDRLSQIVNPQDLTSSMNSETLVQDIKDLRHRIDFISARLRQDDACCICLDPIKNIAIAPCCMTKMCLQCVTQWVIHHHSCVTCREPLTFSDIHIVQGCTSPVPNKLQALPEETRFGKNFSKIQNLEILLRHHVGTHVIICCASENDSKIISDCLVGVNRPFGILQGASKQVSQILTVYQQGDEGTLIINTSRCIGSDGLQGTTDMILFHSLNDDQERVMSGNVNRIGRTHDLRIWHLMNTS